MMNDRGSSGQTVRRLLPGCFGIAGGLVLVVAVFGAAFANHDQGGDAFWLFLLAAGSMAMVPLLRARSRAAPLIAFMTWALLVTPFLWDRYEHRDRFDEHRVLMLIVVMGALGTLLYYLVWRVVNEP